MTAGAFTNGARSDSPGRQDDTVAGPRPLRGLESGHSDAQGHERPMKVADFVTYHPANLRLQVRHCR